MKRSHVDVICNYIRDSIEDFIANESNIDDETSEGWRLFFNFVPSVNSSVYFVVDEYYREEKPVQFRKEKGPEDLPVSRDSERSRTNTRESIASEAPTEKGTETTDSWRYQYQQQPQLQAQPQPIRPPQHPTPIQQPPPPQQPTPVRQPSITLPSPKSYATSDSAKSDRSFASSELPPNPSRQQTPPPSSGGIAAVSELISPRTRQNSLISVVSTALPRKNSMDDVNSSRYSVRSPEYYLENHGEDPEHNAFDRGAYRRNSESSPLPRSLMESLEYSPIRFEDGTGKVVNHEKTPGQTGTMKRIDEEVPNDNNNDDDEDDEQKLYENLRTNNAPETNGNDDDDEAMYYEQLRNNMRNADTVGLKPVSTSLQMGQKANMAQGVGNNAQNTNDLSMFTTKRKDIIGKSVSDRLHHTADVMKRKRDLMARKAAAESQRKFEESKFQLNRQSQLIAERMGNRYTDGDLLGRLYQEGMKAVGEKKEQDKAAKQAAVEERPKDWSCARCGTFHKLPSQAPRAGSKGLICSNCKWDQVEPMAHKPQNLGVALNEENTETLKARRSAVVEEGRGSIHEYLYQTGMQREKILHFNRELWDEIQAATPFAPTIPQSSQQIIRKYRHGRERDPTREGEDNASSNASVASYHQRDDVSGLSMSTHFRFNSRLSGAALREYLSRPAMERLVQTQTRSVMDEVLLRNQGPPRGSASALQTVDERKDFVNRLVYEYREKNQRQQALQEKHSYDQHTGQKLFHPKVLDIPEEFGLGRRIVTSQRGKKKKIWEDLLAKDQEAQARREQMQKKAIEAALQEIRSHQVKALPSSNEILQESTAKNLEELFRLLLACNDDAVSMKFQEEYEEMEEGVGSVGVPGAESSRSPSRGRSPTGLSTVASNDLDDGEHISRSASQQRQETPAPIKLDTSKIHALSQQMVDWQSRRLDLALVQPSVMINEVSTLLLDMKKHLLLRRSNKNNRQRKENLHGDMNRRESPTSTAADLVDGKTAKGSRAASEADEGVHADEEVDEEDNVNDAEDEEGQLLMTFQQFKDLALKCIRFRNGPGKGYIFAPKKKPDLALQLQQNQQKEETFHPEIDKHSQEITRARHEAYRHVPIEIVLQKDGERTQQKLALERAKKEEKEKESLPFKPHLFKSNVVPRYRGMDLDALSDNEDNHNGDDMHQTSAGSTAGTFDLDARFDPDDTLAPSATLLASQQHQLQAQQQAQQLKSSPNSSGRPSMMSQNTAYTSTTQQSQRSSRRSSPSAADRPPLPPQSTLTTATHGTAGSAFQPATISSGKGAPPLHTPQEVRLQRFNETHQQRQQKPSMSTKTHLHNARKHNDIDQTIDDNNHLSHPPPSRQPQSAVATSGGAGVASGGLRAMSSDTQDSSSCWDDVVYAAQRQYLDADNSRSSHDEDGDEDDGNGHRHVNEQEDGVDGEKALGKAKQASSSGALDLSELYASAASRKNHAHSPSEEAQTLPRHSPSEPPTATDPTTAMAPRGLPVPSRQLIFRRSLQPNDALLQESLALHYLHKRHLSSSSQKKSDEVFEYEIEGEDEDDVDGYAYDVDEGYDAEGVAANHQMRRQQDNAPQQVRDDDSSESPTMNSVNTMSTITVEHVADDDEDDEDNDNTYRRQHQQHRLQQQAPQRRPSQQQQQTARVRSNSINNAHHQSNGIASQPHALAAGRPRLQSASSMGSGGGGGAGGSYLTRMMSSKSMKSGGSESQLTPAQQQQQKKTTTMPPHQTQPHALSLSLQNNSTASSFISSAAATPHHSFLHHRQRASTTPTSAQAQQQALIHGQLPLQQLLPPPPPPLPGATAAGGGGGSIQDSSVGFSVSSSDNSRSRRGGAVRSASHPMGSSNVDNLRKNSYTATHSANVHKMNLTQQQPQGLPSNPHHANPHQTSVPVAGKVATGPLGTTTSTASSSSSSSVSAPPPHAPPTCTAGVARRGSATSSASGPPPPPPPPLPHELFKQGPTHHPNVHQHVHNATAGTYLSACCGSDT